MARSRKGFLPLAPTAAVRPRRSRPNTIALGTDVSSWQRAGNRRAVMWYNTVVIYHDLAELYDAENQQHAMLREDVPFFLGQLPRKKQDILELGCGTGRAAIPIARTGHRVVGVDIDPRMIQIAQRKAEAAGLHAPQLELRVADALKLNLRQRFDWVCIVFNTFLAFPTLVQQDACLATVLRHLKPEGRLYLDLMHPNVDLLGIPKSRGLEPQYFYAPSLGTSVLKTIDVDRDPSKQIEKVTFRYRWHDAAGRPRQRLMKFEMTFIFPRELEMLLERHGLEIEYLWGNYDGSPVHVDSPRMICRARRF